MLVARIAPAAPTEISYHAEQKFEAENDERIDKRISVPVI